MEDHLNVLLAESDSEVAERVENALRGAGHACTVVHDIEEAVKRAGSGQHEVVIADYDMGEGQGVRIAEEARSASRECQIILVAEAPEAAGAVESMSHGAISYLRKPVDLTLLNNVVDMAAEIVSLRRDRELLRQQLDEHYGLENIVGRSPQMMDVFKKIRQVAPTDASVLVCGETGTGKELVSRAIHYNSPRQNNRFVPVNCAGIVESILESELFGHEKGAFTSADSSRVGLFEYADHGTLFLDEVGDLASSSQSKLLRVLEEDEVVRVGSNEPIPVDVRVIAATNQDLEAKVKDGSFREDLYYRLNVVRLSLPPLRERQGDIMRLIRHFASEMAEKHGKEVRGLSPAARKFLLRYHWPGNVRELRNAIEHMVVVTLDDVLGEDDLPDYIQGGPELPEEESPSLNSLAGLPLEEVEKKHIRRTLDLVDGNRQKAAELLGIGERTLYRKIQKYDLS